MINLKIGGIIVAAFIAGAFVASPELRAFAANTVGSADIINESILSADIKNGEVKNSELANGAVTSSKIKDFTVEARDMKSDFLLIRTATDSDNGLGWDPDGVDKVFVINEPFARELSVILLTVQAPNNGASTADANCVVTEIEEGLVDRFYIVCNLAPLDGSNLTYVMLHQ